MEHPCIHRIHSSEWRVPPAYHNLGMTIEIEVLLERLRDLHRSNKTSRQKSLITFDDGWSDVLLIPKDFFLNHSSLQPVVFLTDEQLQGHPRWMPLHALYDWMEREGHTLEQLAQLGIDRGAIKDLREQEQHTFISQQQGLTDRIPNYLTRSDLEALTHIGWRFASHGPEHSDLRTLPLVELRTMLEGSLQLLQDLGAEPWLAWPEGRWNDEVATLANEVGFTKQFGLIEEPRKGTSSLVEMRTLW